MTEFPFLPIDEWGDLTLASASLLKVLIEQAKFPVEWLIFDADDNLIREWEIDASGHVATKGDPNEELPSIRWPVTIRATDAGAREWSLTIPGPIIQ